LRHKPLTNPKENYEHTIHPLFHLSGLNHPEMFGWVGGFSSFVRDPEIALAKALANPDPMNKKLKLLWIACGKDDRLIDNSRQFVEVLKKNGIRYELLETEGNHSWPVWRRYLADFAPLLFQERT